MPGVAAVGVHDQLPARQAAVTGGTANAETACRIDKEFCVPVQHALRDHRVDDMAENILPQLLHGHIRLMLGRNYNSFHPCRDSVPVLHGDLGFSIWQQIGQNSLLPHKGKALCQRMGKLNGQRH